MVIFINTLYLFYIYYCQSLTNTFASACHPYNLSQLFLILTYARDAIKHDKFSLCQHAVYAAVFNRHFTRYYGQLLAQTGRTFLVKIVEHFPPFYRPSSQYEAAIIGRVSGLFTQN